MLLLSNSLVIDLLPLVEYLFALGQKPFRHWSKTFSTKGEKLRSGSDSSKYLCICLLITIVASLFFTYIYGGETEGGMVNPNQDETQGEGRFLR